MEAGAHNLGQQLRRERLLDIEQRLAHYRLLAFIVLAVGLLLSGPWVGWWWTAPLVVAGIALAIADRCLERSKVPERWLAVGWGVSPLMIALSVALTGGAESPATPWFALAAVTLATRFERRGVILGALYIFTLLGLSTLPFDAAYIADDPSVVIFPVALIIGTIILSTAIIQSEREHRESSVVDPLTGLLNRAALSHRVAELEAQARTGDSGRVGLIVGDLDHFKAINDEHGHSVGDEVLSDVAYAMRGTLRAFDLIYRVGGEEFLVLLPGAATQDAADIAERLRRAVKECSREGLDLTMSFGIASHEEGLVDFATLFTAADNALYRAKETGRDKVERAATDRTQPSLAERAVRMPVSPAGAG